MVLPRLLQIIVKGGDGRGRKRRRGGERGSEKLNKR